MNGSTRGSLTLFHVLWVAISAGLAWLAFSATRDASMAVRLLITIAAFIAGLIVAHLGMVSFVTALVIPRLEPGSYWSREVDRYMASVFPGQWGAP